MKAKKLTLNISFQLITDIRCLKFMVGISINDAHFGGHSLFFPSQAKNQPWGSSSPFNQFLTYKHIYAQINCVLIV